LVLGDELIPVSKGDCWLFERESEDKPTITPELTKDVKKVLDFPPLYRFLSHIDVSSW